MICAWKELLSILPPWLRRDVDQIGKNSLLELRLRCNAPPELIQTMGSSWLSQTIEKEDLTFVINAASRYSPWSASTLAKGYLTAAGGHRIGVCGDAIYKEGHMTGIRDVQSLCIRVARDISGIWHGNKLEGSVLILGAPGWGKTTLLRDLLRNISRRDTVCVADERGELFPELFQKGKRMDILTGCPKGKGIEILLRTMGPDWISVDEITAEEDCNALIQASNCGIRLAATAHAASVEDFRSRAVYRPLLEHSIFQTLVVLRKDKSYTVERMTV